MIEYLCCFCDAQTTILPYSASFSLLRDHQAKGLPSRMVHFMQSSKRVVKNGFVILVYVVKSDDTVDPNSKITTHSLSHENGECDCKPPLNNAQV